MSFLSDSFGRKHDYLRISLTEKCNLRCTYCMPEEGIALRPNSKFMSREEILAIAQQFVDLGVRKIRLTGGEPLVRKEFDAIITDLSQLGAELSISTNALLLHKHLDHLANSGVKNLNISLDSLQANRFEELTRRPGLETVLQNIDLACKLGFKVKVNVVVMRGLNEDELIPFILFGQERDIEVRFIEFMPFDGNNWNIDRKVSYAEILEKAQDYFGDLNLLPIQSQAHSTVRKFKVKDRQGSFGVISTITNPFCDDCNRIRLTADGKIKNCLFSNDESDLLGAFRCGEDIKSLIQESILKKKKAFGGLDFSDQESVEAHQHRSMISIGG